MADNSSASIQFAQMPTPPSHHREGVSIGREPEVDTPVPLSGQTMSSSDQATMWRVRHGRGDKPLPYSRKTSGSLYRFDQEN
jgi:hypothetical protein